MDNNDNNNVESKEEQPKLNPQFITGRCPKDGLPLSMPAPPIIQSDNVVVSAILIPHPHGVTCRKCNTYYNVAIMDFGVNLLLVEREKPQLNEHQKVIPFSVIPPNMQ